MTTTNPEPFAFASADAYVGDRVHQLMWRQRTAQREIAAVIGVDQSTVSKKLRGERTWLLDEVLAVSRFYGVSPLELLPGDDYAPAPKGRGRISEDQRACRDSNPKPSDSEPRSSRPTRTLSLVVGQRGTQTVAQDATSTRTSETAAAPEPAAAVESTERVVVPIGTRRSLDMARAAGVGGPGHVLPFRRITERTA